MIANHSNMNRRRWSNRYVKRFPNYEVGMDVVCYYSTTSGCDKKLGDGKTYLQKKERPTLKLENEKKNKTN